ncbi:MAG: hypothetical protein PHH00_00955 [Candidatus Nanoarchaeia archaeon]|nr:hypothetical protein [Candidatus Nanoarchaeia archaeon]
MKTEVLYLLWTPVYGWGAYYRGTIPDTGAFPDYFYRMYEVPAESFERVLANLITISNRLRKEGKIPQKSNGNGIFPQLEEVLKES